MRKVWLIAALALTLLLVSCRTTTTTTDYTDEQYDSVLSLVLERSQSDAIVNLFIRLNEYGDNMVPKDYSFLDEYRDRVPGMDSILGSWAHTITDFLIPNFDTFKTFVPELFATVKKPDSKALLQSSDDSISAYYRTACFDDMVTDLEVFLDGLDVSVWHDAAVQYMAWVSTRAMLYDEENPTMGQDFTEQELYHLVAEHLTDLFFTYLARYETLFRTTPDPGMDSLASAILGLE